MPPITPQHNRDALPGLVHWVNTEFGLEIPVPQGVSPASLQRNGNLRWRVYNCMQRLYWLRKPVDGRERLETIVVDLEEWIYGGDASTTVAQGERARQRSEEPQLDDAEKDRRLEYLLDLLKDELYILKQSVVRDEAGPDSARDNPTDNPPSLSPKRRRVSDDEDEFHTAPNSPVKDRSVGPSPSLDLDKLDLSLMRDDPALDLVRESSKPSSFLHRLKGSVSRLADDSVHHPKTCTVAESSEFDDMLPPVSKTDACFAKPSLPSTERFRNERPSMVNSAEKSFLESTNTSNVSDMPPPVNGADTSFSTMSSASLSMSQSRITHSFDTDITEPETQSTYADSVVDLMLEEEMSSSMLSEHPESGKFPRKLVLSVQEQLIQDLVQNGPFSIPHPFSGKIPLRCRYEIERVGRAWDVPLKNMLRGDRVSFPMQDGFWSWISGHSYRKGQTLPEKTPARAWDSAVGHFKSKRKSEVVVLTGALDWCAPNEPGILKLTLNPLQTERTCRFHRRFGSDRFLTLTLPAPTVPPDHLRSTLQPSVLRETIAAWLTRNDHQCLGRTWCPFYVEEVKNKKKVKEDPRFRVEFFAVDGVDFDHRSSPGLARPDQPSDRHTPMGVDALLEWHMPSSDNSNQSNCKLFQRLALGLSKTLVSVTLKPTQIVRLRDDPSWKRVMNDGCALMSKSLAREISDSLGLDGVPSCFQGRIAGAKGVWMVDRHQSYINSFRAEGDLWMQISDSQLKINPHPQEWNEPFDKEKLTFEVVNWSKELHPVDLNIQLLAILEHGGRHNNRIKDRIAGLTRQGIASVYNDVEHVLQADSPVLCRGLMQKLRPSGDGASRPLDQWTGSDAEFIIRLSEAGFAPRSFYPLRKKLQKHLNAVLGRHVDNLKIQVPLSTYAFCIADPYKVLKRDEVHFGFSKKWKSNDPDDPFDDDILDGMDVLVGRLPAHVPSDIQRRHAVWNKELRHFVDVIVFPTQGDMPLAHMLSGGDYDGDMPWICWDQEIVRNFYNSALPESEFPPEHFELTKHSVPMAQVASTEEFLQTTFEFNLTQSNLGRCTMEHEKLAYDESIQSNRALELACLLSHLVDGRKAGVQLSEAAWTMHRNRISPKGARLRPAYRNPDRKPKKSNIVDYLKFWIAENERSRVLKSLQDKFPENEHARDVDEDVARPWRDALQIADADPTGELRKALNRINHATTNIKLRWNQAVNDDTDNVSSAIREANETVAGLVPPTGAHPLMHVWQHSPEHWRRLLASCTYNKSRSSTLVFHIFGEEICDLKSATVPSRSITHDVLAIYRVNARMVSQLSAGQLPGDDEAEVYDGEHAIESLLQGAGVNYDELGARSPVE
ncbi:hypothetical protein N7492_000156 [Penicillium capsulatum]|uniref:RNA-dependent RNA polymerase n=1 Tax=Penicillium capsulatum TaxID=69766 RepID=A0A9W9IPW4_9EURO|nr:hypothetical protein N7492_000156 [Penicillium capsulatum]KAJ6130779.1 hypothetical protein N7512_003559 [Penicillium capsulatum]